jgi:hypothetical protein
MECSNLGRSRQRPLLIVRCNRPPLPSDRLNGRANGSSCQAITIHWGGKKWPMFSGIHPTTRKGRCNDFHARLPLPLARAAVKAAKPVQSTPLVVSDLGSFSVSINGIPLSSSSVMVPPLDRLYPTRLLSWIRRDGTDPEECRGSGRFFIVEWMMVSITANTKNCQARTHPSRYQYHYCTTPCFIPRWVVRILIPTDDMMEIQHNGTTSNPHFDVICVANGARDLMEESNLYTGETINFIWETMWYNPGWVDASQNSIGRWTTMSSMLSRKH